VTGKREQLDERIEQLIATIHKLRAPAAKAAREKEAAAAQDPKRA